MPRVASAAAAHLGRSVSAYRMRAGLTQDELAARTGIDSSNIRAYEGGRAMPNIYSLVRVAEGLGIPPGDLLDGLTLDLFATPGHDRRRRAS